MTQKKNIIHMIGAAIIILCLPHGVPAQVIMTEKEERALETDFKAQEKQKQQMLGKLNHEGRLAYEAENYLDALTAFQQAFTLDPLDTMSRNNLVKAYNAYGTQLIDEGKYLEAIYYMHQAVELADDKVPIAKNISVSYLHLARQQVKEGKIDEAIISYKKIVDYYPENRSYLGELGLLLYNRGVEAYNKRAYDEAEHYLKEALIYRESKSYVYQVLGDVAYFKQELSEAGDYYIKALAEPGLKAQQREEINKKISKLHKEKKVEGKLDSYRSDKFVIRYDKENVQESGYKVNGILRTAYRTVGRDFNHFPQTPVAVIIYNADTFRKETHGGHQGIRAMYDGKIRLPAIDRKTNRETFKSLVWHEYSHALVYELAGPHCPAWLNEGLAQYEENKVLPIKTRVLERAVRSGNTIPVDTIFTMRRPRNVGNIELFYQQAFSMAQYVIKRYRMVKIKEVLQDLRTRKSFRQAWKDRLYLTPQQFEKRWLRHVQKEVGKKK